MHKNHFALIGISLLTALILFNVLQLGNCILDKAYIPPDSYTYLESAKMFYEELTPHPTRPLGYAVLLGVPHLFFDSDSLSIEVFSLYGSTINLVFWLGTILLLYQTLLFFLEKRPAFWATLVFVFCIGNIFQNFLILTETPTTFLLMGMGYFLVKFSHTKNTKHILWGLAFLNLAILFRPGMFYFAGVVTVGAIFNFMGVRRLLRLTPQPPSRGAPRHTDSPLEGVGGETAGKSLLHTPFLLSLLFVAIQLIAIHNTYGNLTASYIDKTTWYLYLGAKANAAAAGIDYKEEAEIRKEKIRDLSWSERSTLSKKDLTHQLTHNPDKVAAAYVQHIFENSIGGNHGVDHTRNIISSKSHGHIRQFLFQVSRIQNGLFVILSFLAFGVFLRKRKAIPFPMWILLGSVGYIILTSGISFWQGDRFHLVFYPVVIVVVASLIQIHRPD